MKAHGILTDARERTRFLRFAVVGAIGAVVDFFVFNLLTSLLGIQGVVAQGFSFVAAVISNFTWNRYWTYPDSRSKPLSRQLIQFFVVNAVGLAIRTPIFAFLEEPLVRFWEGPAARLPDLPFFTARFLGHNMSLAVAVVVVMMWNYFVNRYWTYNDIT